MARALNYAPDAADLNELIRLSLSDWLLQAGHLNMVLADTDDAIAAFSADGRSVVTVGRRGGVKRWDLNTGKLLSLQQLKLSPENRMILSNRVALSPDGQWLFNSGWNGGAGAGELFDLATGEQVWTDAQRETVVDGAFHPDGKSILVADRAKETRFWDLTTHKPIGVRLGPPVTRKAPFSIHVACSPDGKTVLATSTGTFFWDAPTGDSLGRGKSVGLVYAAAFSPDGKYLVTGRATAGAELWEVPSAQSAKLLRTFPEGAQAAAFSPDGRTLLTGYQDRARLWDLKSGAILVSRLQHGSDGIRSVSFSNDGATLLTAGRDNTARLWSAPPTHAKPFAPVAIPVDKVAYRPNGRQVVGWSFSRRRPAVWDVENGKLIKEPQASKPVPPVAVSHDGRVYLVWDSPGRFHLRDLSSDEPIGAPIPYSGQVSSRVQFSPWGPALAVPDGKRCQLWDTRTGKPIGQSIQHPDLWFYAAAASPDGRTIAVGDYGGVSLWDTTSAVMLVRYRHGTNVWRLSFSPDARTILVGPHGMHGAFLDGATLKPIGAPFAIEKPEFPAAFNAKDRTVLIGHTDNLARLWDYTTGTPVGPPLQHQGKVLAVAFSPQGRMVVIGSDDHTARFWDPVLGKPLGRPLRHKGPVRDVAFSPDGKTVATACHESGVQLWPVPAPLDGDPEQLRLYAEVITGVELDEHGLPRALDAKTWQERRSQSRILRGE
jgi:WD40 repeat protein